VCLGAYYLGVHVEDLAYTALDESTVLEKLPEEWRPEPPSTLIEGAQEAQREAEVVTQQLQQDLEQLKQEVESLHSESSTPPADGAASSDTAEAQPAADQATLDYWNELCAKTVEVASLVSTSEQSVDAENAARALELRARVFRYGAEAIGALDRRDVDAQALELGAAMQNWYEHAAELNDESLAAWLSEQQGKTIQGEAARLAAVKQQFDQESALIRKKADAVRQQLQQRYGTEFSPVGQHD
jgi:hypothetical protein